MSEITLIKLPGNLFQPATLRDAEICTRFRVGDCMTLKYSKKRNAAYFRKWWALVDYAYDVWEPAEGMPEKNFERFRKDITIAAGYYDLVPCINGELKAEAQSLKFASMDEDTFASLYDATVSALMKFVLRNHTREDIDNVIRNIGEFA